MRLITQSISRMADSQASHPTGFSAVNIVDHDDYVLMWFLSTSDHRFTYIYTPIDGDEDDPNVKVTLIYDEDQCLVIHTPSM